MDFFTYQDRARVKTIWLRLYFSLACLSLTLLTAVVLAIMIPNISLTLLWVTVRSCSSSWNWPCIVHAPGLLDFGILVVGIYLLISGASWLKTRQLQKSQGLSLLTSLGAERLLFSKSQDSSEVVSGRLLNVVEEMAIAASMPVPKVYLLPHETSINAFAAGFSPESAAITVTSGALESLSREELQGLVAHEMGHIMNGDMRLNTLLIGRLYGISMISEAGYAMIRNGKRALATNLFGIVLVVLGKLGHFIASIIKAALSREQEYFADALAMQLTRNPDAMCGLLHKTTQQDEGFARRFHQDELASLSHMLFASPFKPGALNSHPPIMERIRRMDRNFSHKKWFEKSQLAASRPEGELPLAPLQPPIPRPTGLRVNQVFLTQLDPHLVRTVRDPQGAQAVAVLLILNHPESRQHLNAEKLRLSLAADVYEKLEGLYQAVVALDSAATLPLINLALPALQSLTLPERKRFFEVISHTILEDGILAVREFIVVKVLQRGLFPKVNAATTKLASKAEVQAAVHSVMSAISHVAAAKHSEHMSAVTAAYAAGLKRLQGYLQVNPQAMVAMPNMLQVNAAVDVLDGAPAALKREIVKALGAVVARDGIVSLSEAEFLKAVASAIGCAVPAFLEKEAA